MHEVLLVDDEDLRRLEGDQRRRQLLVVDELVDLADEHALAHLRQALLGAVRKLDAAVLDQDRELRVVALRPDDLVRLELRAS